jgi:hypothetical protein
MSPLGFVSGWCCGSILRTHAAATSPAAPTSMRLVGHEKLEVIFDGGDTETAKWHMDFLIDGDTSRALRKRSIVSVKARANFSG